MLQCWIKISVKMRDDCSRALWETDRSRYYLVSLPSSFSISFFLTIQHFFIPVYCVPFSVWPGHAAVSRETQYEWNFSNLWWKIIYLRFQLFHLVIMMEIYFLINSKGQLRAMSICWTNIEMKGEVLINHSFFFNLPVQTTWQEFFFLITRFTNEIIHVWRIIETRSRIIFVVCSKRVHTTNILFRVVYTRRKIGHVTYIAHAICLISRRCYRFEGNNQQPHIHWVL